MAWLLNMVQAAVQGTFLTGTTILLVAAPEKYLIMATGMDKVDLVVVASGITAAIILAIMEQQVFA